MFELIKQGIGYLLGWIYEFIPNYGWALIVFTFVVKILLLPLGLKQQKSMTKMQVMQPKLEELKEKYKNDQQKQSQEMMKLYKEYGISPMGGCLPMLIQLPILLLLYRVLYKPLTYMLHMSQGDIKAVIAEKGIEFAKGVMEQIEIAKKANLIDFNFLGIDLSLKPTHNGWISFAMLIPVLAAATTYLSSKITMYINQNKQAEKNDNEPAKPQRILSPEQKNTNGQPATAEMSKTMTWMMPIFTLWITTTLPSAMGIYWTASNVFSVVQTIILNGYYAKKVSAEINAQTVAIAEKKQLRYGNKKKKGSK